MKTFLFNIFGLYIQLFVPIGFINVLCSKFLPGSSNESLETNETDRK